MSVGNSVLDKIKEEKIQPKRRWQFLLRNYVVWGVGVVALFVGALAFAVTIHLVSNSGIELYQELGGGTIRFLLLSLPYVWIVLIILFIIIADYYFKHTKRGYKYQLQTVVAASIVGSLLLGGGMHAAGIGKAADDVMAKHVPQYERIMNRHDAVWNRADKGMLLGVITEVTDEEIIMLLDKKQEEWTVNIKDARQVGNVNITMGERVRVLGKKQEGNIFHAKGIGPGRALGPRQMKDLRERLRDHTKKRDPLRNRPPRRPGERK